jgi:hypothetical protein
MSDDIISDYDTVTAADIAEFTRHLAELRYDQPRAGDPTERALFRQSPETVETQLG